MKAILLFSGLFTDPEGDKNSRMKQQMKKQQKQKVMFMRGYKRDWSTDCVATQPQEIRMEKLDSQGQKPLVLHLSKGNHPLNLHVMGHTICHGSWLEQPESPKLYLMASKKDPLPPSMSPTNFYVKPKAFSSLKLALGLSRYIQKIILKCNRSVETN